MLSSNRSPWHLAGFNRERKLAAGSLRRPTYGPALAGHRGRRQDGNPTMRLASLGLLIPLFFGGFALADDPPARKADADSPPTFVRDVLPFLKAHCFHCHGKEEGDNKADL